MLALGLYQADEEVANLLQDTGYVGRRVVVHAVSPEQADGAQHLRHEGAQLWEQSLVSMQRGPWQSQGDVSPLKPLALCHCPDEATRLCLVVLPHIAYLGVICLLHLLQQRLQRLQVDADIIGFLQT